MADPLLARAWNVEFDHFCERVELAASRYLRIDEYDSAYIAHRNGVTASDYALEVVARAGVLG